MIITYGNFLGSEAYYFPPANVKGMRLIWGPLALPSRTLLRTHAAVARILHASDPVTKNDLQMLFNSTSPESAEEFLESTRRGIFMETLQAINSPQICYRAVGLKKHMHGLFLRASKEARINHFTQ